MTSRRRRGGRTGPVFSDPRDPLNELSRPASRAQRRFAESARREQARGRVRRLAHRHDKPLGRRLALYSVLTAGVTLAVWRFTHWAVWRSDPFGVNRVLPDPGGAARTPPPDNLAPGFATQTEPAAWIDPVGLAVGLVLGLLVTWVYARYLEGF